MGSLHGGVWGLKWVWCTPPSSQVQGMLRGLCRHLSHLWQALAVSPHLMYPALPLHAAPGESPEQAAAPPCGVPSLREVCVARIRACLAPGNVCSVLHAVEVLAGAVEELRAPCLECLATHLPQVVAEDGPQFCALSLGCLLELLRGPDVVRLPPRVSGVSCAQPVLLKSCCVWGFDMVRLPVWVCCLCVVCHAWCGLLSGELDAHCPDSPCWSYRYICLALTTCALSSHAGAVSCTSAAACPVQAYCSEASLFRALVVWTHARADCAATQTGNKAALPSTAVADVELLLPHIRFPQMTQDELRVSSCCCLLLCAAGQHATLRSAGHPLQAISQRRACLCAPSGCVKAEGQLAG